MCVCVCVCMCVCVCARVCMRACVHARMRAHMCVRVLFLSERFVLKLGENVRPLVYDIGPESSQILT